MKRSYTNTTTNTATFFTGVEVEKTPAFGKQTLFVVGIQPIDTILAKLNNVKQRDVTHIYFGANQSFQPKSVEELKEWSVMINTILDTNNWVTLDFDVKYSDEVLELTCVEHRRFIPILSVKIPYIRQFSQNAIIKIDDIGFDSTNDGVWCHRLDDLQSPDTFTNWDEYTSDTVVA